ncbi:MAG: arginase family protein [bacterium]
MQNQFVLSPFFLEKPFSAAERLASPSWIINKPILTDEQQMARIAVVHRHLADVVAHMMKDGHRPVSIAGDCCTTIGVLKGLQRSGVNPLLLWLDAHGDFNTWETSPSGFVGGMPLAMIVGRGDQTLMQAAGLTPRSEREVFLINARDLDPEERKALLQSAVHHVTDISSLPQLLPPERPIYVHLDVDVIDQREAPAMAYPVPGGPDLDSLCEMAERLANTGRVIAVSMTLWDLESDTDGRTERASMALLKALLGNRYSAS